MWLAEDLSRVPLTLVSKKSVRDLRRRVSGRDKERREREREADKVDRFKEEEEEIKQGDQVESTMDRVSPKDATKLLERPGRNLRDGLKSILSLTRLPKLAPPSSCMDGSLSKSPLDMDPSSWNGYNLPSSTSLLSHQDVDLDMDSSSLSRTSSIRSSSSHSSSGEGARQPRLILPGPADMDSSSLSRTSSIRSSSSYSSFSGGGARQSILKLPSPGVMPHDLPCLSRDSSLRKFRDRVRGTRPTYRLGRAYLDERHGEMGWKEGEEGREDEKEGGQVHLGPNLSRHLSLRSNTSNGRLVAVKMTPRKVRGAKGRRERAEEERTRVGFVREVEVLKVSRFFFAYVRSKISCITGATVFPVPIWDLPYMG